jgi:hypothetical protein
MLSIVVAQPLLQGGKYLRTYTDEFNAYRHSVKAIGGYWDASFTLRHRLDQMEDWLTDGLGRHVVVKDDALQVVWEGFVDKVTITYGPISVVCGPLSDVANIVSVNYSSGGTVQTSWKYDAASIAKYGFFQKVLSASNITAAEATQIRDQYLHEHCRPEIKQDVGTSNHEANIIIDCLGYVHYLDKTYYEVPNGGSADELAVRIGITQKLKLAMTVERNEILTCQQLLANNGFQTAGAGTPDVFANWTEHAGVGSIAQVAIGRPNSPDADNPYSAKLTTALEAANRDTYMYQELTLTPEKSYAMSVWHKGSSSGTAYSAKRHGSSALRWGSIFGHADAEWMKCASSFYTPAGVSLVDFFLYGPSNIGTQPYNYFDDVRVVDYPHVTENTYEVYMLEKDTKTAWTVIKDLLAYGDSSNNRYLFGVYADRTPYYLAAPTTFEYHYRTLDNKHQFTSVMGEAINDWNVLPGKWVRFNDFLVGASEIADLNSDPRAMFIEEVRYSADEGLTLNAGRLSPLQQALYKLGIMSIGD